MSGPYHDANDWSHYEALLPRPSHSVTGRFSDCKTSTIPHVRTFLRSQAYERTVTRPKQANRDDYLARPKAQNVPPAEVAEARKLNKQRLLSARQRQIIRQTPEISVRARMPELPPRPVCRADAKKEVENDDKFSEKYSETPIHKRTQQNKVFELPEFVAQERAIITSGRTFTWGGRMKLPMPGFDPTRQRLLTETHL